ncbi:hypothetical protein BDR07DRAFT_306307 [Suillus spraguei]|nr:hypothetical protein BDR07DRAFT_306307 [Suillus spraguei]
MLAVARQRPILLGMSFLAMTHQYLPEQVMFHPHTMHNMGTTASRRSNDAVVMMTVTIKQKTHMMCFQLMMGRIGRTLKTGRILKRLINSYDEFGLWHDIPVQIHAWLRIILRLSLGKTSL